MRKITKKSILSPNAYIVQILLLLRDMSVPQFHGKTVFIL
jgi:hypothetical protein